MGNRRLFLFLVFVFADYVRGDEYPCSGACAPTERSVFKVGHTYVYEYTAYGLTRVNISDSGQLNRNVSLTLSSELEIYVLSPCDLILKLQKVDLKSMTDGHADQDIDESKLKEFVKVLTENSVQIHYRNGSIPEICVHEDPTWALNIKRGIVSMLQYSWEDANYTQIETDILGSCEHQYTSTEVDDWRVIKKKSNLNRCITRGSNVLLNGNTDVKYVNPIDVLRSTRFCKYVLGNTQQPLLVTCKERHRFMPFYTAKNMLVTNLTQALSLDRIVIKEMPTIDQQLQKENLMFQFEDKLSVRLESLKEARNVINSFLDKPSKTAILQSRAFVALAANATAQEMMEAINDPEYPNSRNIEMVDALFRIWTPESAKFVLKLVEEDVRVMPWLAFLPFVRDPSADMLLNLEPFLEIPEHRVNAIMGISGMVHNYCAGREGCASETCVAPLLRHWEAPLAAILFKKMPRMSSKVAAFDYQGVFLGLKAVGNAGVTNNLKAIVTIILDSTITAEIRIAALESFRRMPSLLKLACEDILGVMMKTDDDPEVRITSYFAVLKCQPQKLLEKLVFLLQFEDANEVTSFVWKHLQAESSKLPELLINRIGSIFQDGFFRAKYQMEIGNSADHVGMNKSFPAMQSTLFTDTNIIYKNGLPWVANFKTGLSMFSNRTDIIEVDAHFRDINSLLLAVVGQTGDLAMYVLGQAVDDSEERHQNNEISQPRIFETNPSFLARQLQGQISVKILGNEFYILNAYDIYLKHILHVKILMNVHSKHIKLRDTLLEWQETFLFPTASGFPFEFSMNTTAKSHLDINCGKAFKNAPSAKIDFELNTVAGISLDASGAMSLDAYILKKGLNLTVNAGIMKEFNASIHLDKDKLLSSDFSLPPSVDNRADINWSVAEVY